MTPQRWARIREVFAVAMETPERERPQFLDSACGGDTDLRFEVEQLLVGIQEPSWRSPTATWLSLGAGLAPGDTLAQYRIDAKLGEGGMGLVYRAYDIRLHREVALKVLQFGHLADPERRQRLLREARAASALNHPNIVTVYEIGAEGNVDFIAMEYVEGQSLAHAIPPGGLPILAALSYAIEIATALIKAHAAGVIHRDLKSANIMLTKEGHIKLLDFGLARLAPRAGKGTGRPAAEDQISGTPGYMSPEQIQGLPIDHRTDLFSFGVVLYEMFTGERPFTGVSAMAVCDAVLHDPVPAFRSRVLAGKLAAIIRKLLEKDPSNRYEGAGEVQQKLKEVEGSLTQRTVQRRLRNSWVAGTIAVLICILTGWFWREWSQERWALEGASPEAARLVDSGEYAKAAELVQQARRVLPKDPLMLGRFSVSIE